MATLDNVREVLNQSEVKLVPGEQLRDAIAEILANDLAGVDASLLKGAVESRLNDRFKQFIAPPVVAPAPVNSADQPGTLEYAAARIPRAVGLSKAAPGAIVDASGGLKSHVPMAHNDLRGGGFQDQQQPAPSQANTLREHLAGVALTQRGNNLVAAGEAPMGQRANDFAAAGGVPTTQWANNFAVGGFPAIRHSTPRKAK
jgi:hypothetical protein